MILMDTIGLSTMENRTIVSEFEIRLCDQLRMNCISRRKDGNTQQPDAGNHYILVPWHIKTKAFLIHTYSLSAAPSITLVREGQNV